MRVLVSGASGFVGTACCRALLAAGYSVRAAVRRVDAAVVADCETVYVGSIGADTPWSSALQGIDAVVHLAAHTHARDDDRARETYSALNVDGTRTLARAALAAGVVHIVFMSSIKVNGEHSERDDGGGWRRLSGTDVPQPVTHYGRSKWAAEQLLGTMARDTATAVTVLRPPLVYGPGQKANLHLLMRAVDAGIPLPLANVENLRSLIYVDNLAAAVVSALASNAAAIRTYTLADIDLSTPALIRAIALGLGRPARLFPFPQRILALGARALGRGDQIERLSGSLVVDHTLIRRDLGWRPPVPFEQAIGATVESYRRQRDVS